MLSFFQFVHPNSVNSFIRKVDASSCLWLYWISFCMREMFVQYKNSRHVHHTVHWWTLLRKKHISVRLAYPYIYRMNSVTVLEMNNNDSLYDFGFIPSVEYWDFFRNFHEKIIGWSTVHLFSKEWVWVHSKVLTKVSITNLHLGENDGTLSNNYLQKKQFPSLDFYNKNRLKTVDLGMQEQCYSTDRQRKNQQN